MKNSEQTGWKDALQKLLPSQWTITLNDYYFNCYFHYYLKWNANGDNEKIGKREICEVDVGYIQWHHFNHGDEDQDIA